MSIDFYTKQRTWLHFCNACGYVYVIEATFSDIIDRYRHCPECNAKTPKGMCSIPDNTLAIGDEKELPELVGYPAKGIVGYMSFWNPDIHVSRIPPFECLWISDEIPL